jgi:hypothetical protein
MNSRGADIDGKDLELGGVGRGQIHCCEFGNPYDWVQTPENQSLLMGYGLLSHKSTDRVYQLGVGMQAGGKDLRFAANTIRFAPAVSRSCGMGWSLKAAC